MAEIPRTACGCGGRYNVPGAFNWPGAIPPKSGQVNHGGLLFVHVSGKVKPQRPKKTAPLNCSLKFAGRRWVCAATSSLLTRLARQAYSLEQVPKTTFIGLDPPSTVVDNLEARKSTSIVLTEVHILHTRV